MKIEEVNDNHLAALLSDYDGLGGVMDFKFFKTSGSFTNRDVHLSVACHTLSALAHDNQTKFDRLAKVSGVDRDVYFKITVEDISEDTGKQISIDEFFGPFFEIKTERPIIREKKGKPLRDFRGVVTFSDYYYYDDIEEANIVKIAQPMNKNGFVIEGYADAFLQPPYGFGGNYTNLEIGKFFLQFNRAIFGNIDELTIYSWPIDCSTYFDAGKEYWGSFLWTVYCPQKDWYIGIAASTTD